jgi:predicted Zn-dependent protease
MASALLGPSQLPVTHVNAPLNAAVAQSLALQGRTAEAKALFDQVLMREPDQPEALRDRSALEARTGNSRQAILDAQRLVTLRPKSGSARLVLARAYFAAKNAREVRRTLWQAFQDLPDDEQVRAALRSVLVSTGDLDGQRRLDDEYADHRRLALTKDMVQ